MKNLKRMLCKHDKPLQQGGASLDSFQGESNLFFKSIYYTYGINNNNNK